VTVRAGSHDRAAVLVCAARIERRELGPLPPELRPRDEAEAYLVQDEVHRRLTAAGWGDVVGHKLGCTTPVMQAQLGLDHPVSGGIFASTVHHGTAVVRHADYVRPGVESEIVVLLDADLPATGEPYTRESVAPAVGACIGAIELTDARYDDDAVDVPTRVADDFYGAGSVLGPPDRHFDPRGLDRVHVRLEVNGEPIGEGDGSMVLGHPLEALAWFANATAQRGQHLRAGEFVSLGSVVPAYRVEAGDEARVTFDPFGEVSVRYL
jgi:2-oxo-3-hexenedioate decarboxylase/2-keto-4-pentenoate hydratase